ncbi:MAG: hypothetical protein IT302_00830 [Dehalococcoidia bacterium]|nr:hypothetical protein [Dehalococcoidia bacterium]
MRTSLARRAGLLAAATLAAFALAACGGSKTDSQTAAVAGLGLIEHSGFHELDESLTKDGKVPPTAHTTAKHIQAVALATDWPKDLQDKAKTMATAMDTFAKAIDTDTPDIKKATELSNAAHKAWHDFTGAAWEYLYQEAGLKTAAGETHSH